MTATLLPLSIAAQPNETTCGPTCLHAVYRYYDDALDLQQVIDDIDPLQDGGTLDVFLACHALRRGYRALIHPYNLRIFDPTWFELAREALTARLQARRRARAGDAKLQIAIRGYLEFLELGGEVRLVDLTPRLIRNYLRRGVPVLTGLSATYLYRTAREIPETCAEDDVRGEPVGHFVVLYGHDKETRTVRVADPYSDNPLADSHYYSVPLERLIGAIFLGIMTFDANLLIIEPRRGRARNTRQP